MTWLILILDPFLRVRVFRAGLWRLGLCEVGGEGDQELGDEQQAIIILKEIHWKKQKHKQ